MAEGFLKLFHLEEAVDLLLDNLPGRDAPAVEVELFNALGRVVARDIASPEDLPGFARSTMDGFAVRASDTYGAGEGLPAYLEVVGEVPMGGASPNRVNQGRALGISTGGVLPGGADAVVMVENTQVEEDTVEVTRSVAPGENVIRPDEDIAKGDVILSGGRVIGPAQIGALAGLGMTVIEVFELPTIGIISTGDELVPPATEPDLGQVRDINSPALSASIARAGCLARTYGIVKDEFDKLLDVSRRAHDECDALIISGGSSAGTRDITVDVLDELGDPGVLVHGIYLKPGKPTIMAVCDGKPVMGLPGNPASALAVFREVVLPVLERLRGVSTGVGIEVPRVVEAVMGRSVASAGGRLELVPVSLSSTEAGLVASPIMGKSSLIGTLALAGGQVRIPEGSEGLERGQRVLVELLE